MSHGRNPGWYAGGHWVTCQRCGFEYRAEEVRKTWDGLIVCKDDWEPRHPQDFVRAVEDDTRPIGLHTGKPTDTFVEVDTNQTVVRETTIPSGTFNTTDPLGS